MKYFDLTIQSAIMTLWIYNLLGVYSPYGGGYVILFGGFILILGWQTLSAIISIAAGTPFRKAKIIFLIILFMTLLSSALWIPIYAVMGDGVISVVLITLFLLTIYYFILTASWCFGRGTVSIRRK